LHLARPDRDEMATAAESTTTTAAASPAPAPGAPPAEGGAKASSPPLTSLYVGGLGPDVVDSDLYEKFAQAR